MVSPAALIAAAFPSLPVFENSVNRHKLGNSDLSITPLGFGAWAIGGADWKFGWGPQDDADSITAIRHAVERGVNWIDTAAVYGLGHSEEVVARALADYTAAKLTGITVTADNLAAVNLRVLASTAEGTKTDALIGTVVANEEVTADGRSDRGNFPVFKRNMRQWMMRITSYAERLLDDLDDLDWPESIKLMQRNWIGRSEGAHVDFAIDGRDEPVTVYTTRPDTLFGATFFVTEGFDSGTNKRDYMTWDEIAQLHRDGFEIGNHTETHSNLRLDSPDRVRQRNPAGGHLDDFRAGDARADRAVKRVLVGKGLLGHAGACGGSERIGGDAIAPQFCRLNQRQ